MAKAASLLYLAGLLAIVTLVSLSEAKESISCGTVAQQLGSCGGFLKQPNMKKPSQACCNGVKALNNEVKSKNDRIDVCNCVKQVLASIGEYDPKRIPQLPGACDLSINLPPVDKNTDCNKVALMA